MTEQQTLTQILELFSIITNETPKALKGVKQAKKRIRINLVKLEKLGKIYRKLSYKGYRKQIK